MSMETQSSMSCRNQSTNFMQGDAITRIQKLQTMTHPWRKAVMEKQHRHQASPRTYSYQIYNALAWFWRPFIWLWCCRMKASMPGVRLPAGPGHQYVNQTDVSVGNISSRQADSCQKPCCVGFWCWNNDSILVEWKTFFFLVQSWVTWTKSSYEFLKCPQLDGATLVQVKHVTNNLSQEKQISKVIVSENMPLLTRDLAMKLSPLSEIIELSELLLISTAFEAW